ncbi:IS3 family transposase [[Brevibacterium] frigoritolerans]|uniref:IS3 family transposase n=1 Tax=Peribacillus frigoritolerans TaxID=450367 RepID=A0A941J2P9_9BACI|nr:IS3 family transposase [Peribacillus frigoritolerans]
MYRKLFSHLKTEKLYLKCPKTAEQAYLAIQEYIEFYNTARFQEKFNGLSQSNIEKRPQLKNTLFYCLLDRVMCTPPSFIYHPRSVFKCGLGF